MKKICVYTCITGDYDQVHEITKKEKGVDYLLFTNNKNLVSRTWQVVYIEDPELDNQRLSRKIKMLGHPMIDQNYDISVWQDASVVFLKSVVEFIHTYLKENAFAAFVHHARNCIYEEAKECIKKKKDKKEIILRQMDFLKKHHFPEHYGLCEMTVFIKKHRDPIVKKTMEMWFDMICRYSKRDQLSFMYCVYLTHLQIDYIPLNVWNNEWFHCYKHQYKKELDTCRVYFGSDLNFDPNLEVQPTYQKEGEKFSFQVVILATTNCIEIELTDIPCIAFSSLKIEGIKPDHIYPFNFIEWKGENIFYNGSGIVKLEGTFFKGEVLQLTVSLRKLSDMERYDFIEFLSVENIKLKDELRHLKEQKEELLQETQKLGLELSRILHSKSWKITKPLRVLLNRKKENKET